MTGGDRLIHLLELPPESLESPEVVASIRSLLERDDEALQYYIRWCTFDVSLRWTLEGTGADPSIIAAQVQRQRQATLRFWIYSAIASTLLMLVIGIQVWSSMLQRSTAYREEPRLAALWETVGESHSGNDGTPIFPLIRAGDRLRIPGGRFLIHFDSGATASCVGAVDLEVVNGWELSVHRGDVCVQVPPRAHGFRVNTEAVQIVDLGTLFGVRVNGAGGTEIHVLRGRIQATPRQSAPFEMTAGSACKVNPLGQADESLPADSAPFLSQLASLAGIASISGQIRLLPVPPASVSIQDFVTDNVGWLFEEQHHVTLTAPLDVGRAKPGLYTKKQPRTVQIPAGTTVSSYLVHVEGENDTAVEGTVSFDNEIIGLIFTTTQLDQTDGEFGHPQVTYPSMELHKKRNSARGFLEGADLLEIMPDRRTIRVAMFHRGEGSGLDQVRILTKSSYSASKSDRQEWRDQGIEVREQEKLSK